MLIIMKEDLEKLKPLTDVKKGSYGTCFLYDNDKVLKAYSNTLDFYYNKREIKRNIKKNIKKSMGIYVKDVAFPIDIAQVDGYKFSYIMPYIEGISFNDLLNKIINSNFDMSFDDFINLYHDAIAKAYEIASLGTEMNDFHKNNCKIKEDFTIGIFDVDFYESKALFCGFIEKYLRHYNMLEVNDAFSQMLVCLYNAKLKNCKSDNRVLELKKLDKIIEKFPRNKKNYVDDVLSQVNEELKVDSVKRLILGDL